MVKSDYVVFDVETGGLDEKKNPMTQYAAIILDGSTLKEKDRFETYIKPYADLIIEKQAIEATMVTMADVNSGMRVKDFVEAVTRWWDSYRVAAKSREAGRLVAVGHNVPFDIRFVDYALRFTKCGTIYDYIQPNFVDTYVLGKITWGITGKEKLNLTACCKLAGVNLRDAHGAMNDVEMTADLFRFYSKRLRSKRGTNREEVEGSGENIRPKGDAFFEFKCVE